MNEEQLHDEEDLMPDFSQAKLEDFKVIGEETVEEKKEEITEEVKPEVKEEAKPVTEVAPEVKAEVKPEEKKEEKATEKEPAREYQFKDDFIKQLVEYYEKTGDVTPYIEAKAVDFTKMSDEDIMRRELREQYPSLSDKAFDKLFKQQVIDKYKLDADEYGEEDAELGKELLQAESQKIRQKFIDWQKGFKAPEPEIPKEQVDEQKQLQEAVEKFQQKVTSDPITKSLLESKRLAIKVGDVDVNYDIPDAESLVEMTLDNNKFFSQFAAEDGNIDLQRWFYTTAFAKDPAAFIKTFFDQGLHHGRSEVTKEIKNPQIGKTGDTPDISAQDWRTGLLQAFAERGVHK